MDLPIFFAITFGLIVVFLGGLGFLAFAREEIENYRSNFFRNPSSAMFKDLLNTFTFGGWAPAAAGLWFLGWVLILCSVIGEVVAIIIAFDAIINAIIIGLRVLFNWARGISYSSTTTDLLCAELLLLSGPQLRAPLGVVLIGKISKSGLRDLPMRVTPNQPMQRTVIGNTLSFYTGEQYAAFHVPNRRPTA